MHGSQGGLPVHYVSQKAKKSIINEDELYLWDIKAFNSKVGRITNIATSAFALLPFFQKYSREYSEIVKRLKCFRKEQGDSIDSAKGLIVKKFPDHWCFWKKIPKDADEETKKELEFKNSIIIDKRPLFMRHRYSGYNNKYIKYNSDKNLSCLMNFSKTLAALMEEYKTGQEISEEELLFVKNYYRYNPFIESDCVMNNVCRYMERTVKEIRFSSKCEDISEVVAVLKNKDISTDPEKLKRLYTLYEQYRSEKRNFSEIMDDTGFAKFKTVEQFNKYIRGEASKISSDASELCNLAIDIVYLLKTGDNKSFLWDVFGQDLIENIMLNRQENIFVPVKDQNGNIEFLGDRYSMREITLDKIEEDINVYL